MVMMMMTIIVIGAQRALQTETIIFRLRFSERFGHFGWQCEMIEQRYLVVFSGIHLALR